MKNKESMFVEDYNKICSIMQYSLNSNNYLLYMIITKNKN